MKHGELTAADRLFLLEVLHRTERGQSVDPLQLLIDLRDQLPNDFSLSRLDRLLRGNQLTARALYLIDPKNQLLVDANCVIQLMRQRLLTEPRPSEVQTTDIAQELGFDFDYTLRLLELAFQVDHYSNGWSSSSSGPITSININGENAIRRLLSFESLETDIERQLKPVLMPRALPWAGDLLVDSYDGYMPPSVTEPGTAFILMSMDPEDPGLTEICDTIKEVCKTFGITACRVDDIQHSSRITDMILRNIETAEYIIADLSGERPNVYYEIGYAHALKKEPILYRRKGTKLHFDLSIHKAPEYENTAQLRKLLTMHLQAIASGSAEAVAEPS